MLGKVMFGLVWLGEVSLGQVLEQCVSVCDKYTYGYCKYTG